MYRFELRFSFELLQPNLRPATQDANLFTKQMKKIMDFCRTKIIAAQARWEDYTNLSRKPARRYLLGQKVWLNAWNIQTLRP
jgi:hypothetical protein